MSVPVTNATAVEWPADVLELAAKEGVQPYLAPLLEATQRIFPTANWVKVRMDTDPELRDERHITFDVQVSYGPELEPAVAQAQGTRKQWGDELFRICPAPLTPVFRLLLDLQSS